MEKGFVTVLVLVGSLTVLAKTMYVAPSGSDENDGSSFATPFKTIQRAVDEAVRKEMNEIVISNGTYVLSQPIEIPYDSSDKASTMGLRLRSFSGASADVVIDGNNACACLWNRYSQNYVALAGLTIQNGVSTEQIANFAGGLYSNRGMFITNCVVRNCRHTLAKAIPKPKGGGVCLIGQELPTNTLSYLKTCAAVVDTRIEDCSLTIHSTAEDQRVFGGGFYASKHSLDRVSVERCGITNDSTTVNQYAMQGGGAYLLACFVSNCLFSANYSHSTATATGDRGQGGGLYVAGNSSDNIDAYLSDSQIVGSRANGSGAGLGVGGLTLVERVAVTNNAGMTTVGIGSGSLSGGGGVLVTGNRVTLRDCLIADNETFAGAIGGGVTVVGCDDVRIEGSVIRENAATTCGGVHIANATDVIVSNCVITANRSSSACSSLRILENVYSTNGTEDVSANVARSNAVQIVESFIVANTNVATESKNEGGTIYVTCGGNADASKNRRCYLVPVCLRNCLVARNEDNFQTGWGVRVDNANNAQCDKFPCYGVADNDFFLFDHCTFAGNRCLTSQSYVVYCRKDATANILAFRGCVFTDNLYRKDNKTWSNGLLQKDSGVTVPHVTNTHSDSGGGFITVTDENGNHTGTADFSLGFSDPASYDYGLTKSSDLIDKGGAFADWMGDGRAKAATRDLSGGFQVMSSGPHGVTVVRPGSKPRRSGAASDMGCCEWRTVPGLFLLVP